jgi:hypothetical protein
MWLVGEANAQFPGNRLLCFTEWVNRWSDCSARIVVWVRSHFLFGPKWEARQC